MADNKLLAKLLSVRQAQNFDDTDSLIASTILHPITAAQKAGNWFSNQVNTAAGTGVPYDVVNPFYTNENNRIEAAANLAGFANVSGMPFAPKSNGATLGTVLKPSFQKEIPNSLADELTQAHEIARINAAKPISEGGLGLPETNTAMDRAKALGFDVDNKYFHGTRRNFDYFEPIAPIGALGNKKGIYFSKDKSLAEAYAEDVDGALDEKSRIISTYLKDPEIKNSLYSGEEAIIEDPVNIRDITAAFDPLKRNSANLLASTLLGSLLLRNKNEKNPSK